MKHFLEEDPFFHNLRLYPKADEWNKNRMQKLLVDWYISELDLFDAKGFDTLYLEIQDGMHLDLHLNWLPAEEYEICELYKDAIKNCRDILIGVL